MAKEIQENPQDHIPYDRQHYMMIDIMDIKNKVRNLSSEMNAVKRILQRIEDKLSR